MTANRKPSSSDLRDHMDVEGSQSQAQSTLFVRKLQSLKPETSCCRFLKLKSIRLDLMLLRINMSRAAVWLYLGIVILGGVLS